MEKQDRSPVSTITPAVPRPLGFLMLGVTLTSIILLLLGLAVHVI